MTQPYVLYMFPGQERNLESVTGVTGDMATTFAIPLSDFMKVAIW